MNSTTKTTASPAQVTQLKTENTSAFRFHDCLGDCTLMDKIFLFLWGLFIVCIVVSSSAAGSILQGNTPARGNVNE
jgi:hypothetical protein